MQEDWAILESIFASRKAISELHRHTDKVHEQSASSSSGTTDMTPSFKPGAHGRNLSSATGVKGPAIEDILPPSRTVQNQNSDDTLARRFSRRGMRLAVHSSILDSNAHEIPMSLKKRWFNQVRRRRSVDQAFGQDQSFAQLSRISEVNSSMGPEIVLEGPTLQRSASTPDGPSQQASEGLSGQQEESQGPTPKAKKRSMTLMESSVARTLGKAITRLSNVTTNSGRKKESAASKADRQADAEEKKTSEDKTGWSYRLSKPFVKDELTTPDFNKDAENIALR